MPRWQFCWKGGLRIAGRCQEDIGNAGSHGQYVILWFTREVDQDEKTLILVCTCEGENDR